MSPIQNHARTVAVAQLILMITLFCGWPSESIGAKNAGTGATASKKHVARSMKNKSHAPRFGDSATALITRYMEMQAEELRHEISETQVKRFSENIRIVFKSDQLFSTDSDTISTDSQDTIRKLSSILNKFADTNVVISGHTDSIGSEAANQSLSEKRAEAVTTLLRTFQVSGHRLSTVGYGESRPIAKNKTDAGRCRNRRIEIVIHPDKELKRQAHAGELRL